MISVSDQPRRRWRVRVRFRRWSCGEVVGETNAYVTFWFKRSAEHYADRFTSQPGYVAFVERS